MKEIPGIRREFHLDLDQFACLTDLVPGRFQVLAVDADTPIKSLVQENGLRFNVGRGFYEFTKEFTKTETIQAGKEVVLIDKKTGDRFSGRKARELLGLPDGETTRLKPTSLEKYAVFVQSTSAKRKLMGGTRFLYEVEDWAAKRGVLPRGQPGEIAALTARHERHLRAAR